MEIKVETYKIKGWKEKQIGLLVSENADWILVKYIPADYIIDGYKLYNKKFVKKRKAPKNKKIELVLRLKNIELTNPDTFEFGNVLDILTWSEKKYGLFEFQDESEKELFYGKLNQIIEKDFIIDMIKAGGKIEKNYDYQFSSKKIRAIGFETDYFNSVVLLMENEMGKTA